MPLDKETQQWLDDVLAGQAGPEPSAGAVGTLDPVQSPTAAPQRPHGFSEAPQGPTEAHRSPTEVPQRPHRAPGGLVVRLRSLSPLSAWMAW